MIKIVKEEIIGKNTVAGTEFPITLQLQRQQIPGRKPEWVIVTVCNGVGSCVGVHRTLRAAKRAF